MGVMSIRMPTRAFLCLGIIKFLPDYLDLDGLREASD
jgi:hypothetical protein